ncbi:hypothetical protein [Streptomyces ureilyticus]|uniref:Transposase n=1 Tax=Streptomyces ureilyticus TaxID=1775131 RepID=A0ABX0DXP4_9ACTN|nr:hypothetical protein [Streptomyces ureilyticus]NGO45410.1 hypothetical protein [Streptomyces ureilyticus]
MFAQFIEGLLAELPKKNGWTLSERAGHVTADRMQWLLNGSVWDADRLRDADRNYVIGYWSWRSWIASAARPRGGGSTPPTRARWPSTSRWKMSRAEHARGSSR